MLKVLSFVSHVQARASEEGAPKDGKEVLSQTIEDLAQEKRAFTSYVRAGSVSADGTSITNEPPVVREYQWTEEDGGPPCEDQGSPNTDTTQFGDCENVDRSATLPTAKRWGWGHALLGAVQNAVPKRRKEQKQPHFTFHQKTLSLPPLRFGRYPPGLKKRGSWESTKW